MKLNYYGFIALLLTVQAITSFRAYAQPTPQDPLKRKEPFKNLGPQVAERWLEGTIFTVDSVGNEWVYTVLRGKPGYLLGYNLSSKKIMVNLPLERMDGSWDITVSSDGWLYIAGSAGGHLAKHRPGSQTIQNLGKPLESESHLFAVTPGKDGAIFGATYPGCRIFRYHPKDGFTDVGKGPIVEGQNYVHGIAYHEKTNKLFAGIGSKSYLVEVDVKTGKKREILPEKYQGLPGFVYDMSIVKGLKGGDRLFANLPDLGKTIVYNLDKKEIDLELPRIIMVKAVKKSLTDDKVYYTDSVHLYEHDLLKPNVLPKKILRDKRAMNMGWGKDKNLYYLSSEGNLVKYNPLNKQHTITDIGLPPQPISINITKQGPDGRIWTGGYLVGSNAVYDPISGKTLRHSGLHQSESITVHGTDMYFGIYPKGKFYKYDTTKPWDVRQNNPSLLGKIDGQDRPFAGIGIPGTQRIFFGTVPDYGRLGGALIEYNPTVGKLIAHEGVVKQQSIVSLTYHNNEIIGGTSVWGGLGIVPTATAAKLFGWDPVQGKKTFEVTPLADAKAITSLIVGPDHNLWGVADGVLFIFDTKTRQVIFTSKIYERTAKQKSSAVWRDASLVKHPSGAIYGTGNGRLFKIDPVTKEIKIISTRPANHVSVDRAGNLYYSQGQDLWRYTP
jgi:streptogramin lyase